MSSAYEGLPIYRAATDLVVYFEVIVRSFSRYHKYTIGSEMRNLSYVIVDFIVEANFKINREENIKAALRELRKLKTRVKVCLEIKAFHNPNSFSAATRKIESISKQCEGWLRSCQNPGRPKPSGSVQMKSLGAHATRKTGIRVQGAVPQGSAPDGPVRGVKCVGK